MSTTRIYKTLNYDYLKILHTKYKDLVDEEFSIKFDEFVLNLEKPQLSFYKAILLHYDFLEFKANYLKNKSQCDVLNFMKEFSKRKRSIYNKNKGSHLLSLSKIIFQMDIGAYA